MLSARTKQTSPENISMRAHTLTLKSRTAALPVGALSAVERGCTEQLQRPLYVCYARTHTHTQEPLAGVVGGEKSQTARGYDFENRLACAGLKNRAAATAAADELWRRQYCCYNFTSGFAGGTYNRGTACDQAGTAGNRHVHVCTHHPDSGSGVHR